MRGARLCLTSVPDTDECLLRSTLPEGAYFVLVNTSRLEIPSDFEIPDLIKGRARDWVVAWFVAQT